MSSRNPILITVLLGLLCITTAGFCFSNVARTDHWKSEYVDLSLTLGSGANADQVENLLYADQNPTPGVFRAAVTWTNAPHMLTVAGSTLMYSYSTTDAVTGNKQTQFRSDFWDVGVLYGRRLLAGRQGILSASAGLAVTHLNYKDNVKLPDGSQGTGIYESTGIGVPIDVHALWTVTRGFGLGLDVFANLNPKNIFYGGGLSFNAGF